MKKSLVSILLLVSTVFSQNTCETKLFTIKSAAGISLKEYITNLADDCRLNIIVKDKLAKRKLYESMEKINLDNVSLYELLDILLGSKGLYYELNTNILKIGYLQTKTFNIDYVISKRTSETTTNASVDTGTVSNTQSNTQSNNSGDINKITSQEEYDFWQNLKQEIYDILNRPEDTYKAPEPIVNPHAGLITVTGTQEQIKRVERYINLIEKRSHNEVLIDVSILAVVLDDSYSHGIDWSSFTLSLPNGTFQFKREGGVTTRTTTISTSLSLNKNILIDFLKKNGKVITLSNPKILTLNNQPAIVSIGDTYYYKIKKDITPNANNAATQTTDQISSIFVGILLNITPEITDDGDIILRINPSISELRDPQQITTNTVREIAPDTKEKKLSTVVKVKDGSTLIIGGLISNTNSDTLNGIPVLRSIPVIGNIFGNRSKSANRIELVFIIQPKIISTQENTNISLKDLGYKELK